MKTRIRELRKEAKMTQVRLSVELGVAQETVSGYERGKSYPGIKNLIKMSEMFHASTDYILGLSDIRNPQLEIGLTNDETLLLARYRSLGRTGKEKVAGYLDALLN